MVRLLFLEEQTNNYLDQGSQKISENLKPPYVDLFNCVVIHKLGYWFNHLSIHENKSSYLAFLNGN
jgi:hypothetical protein